MTTRCPRVQLRETTLFCYFVCFLWVSGISTNELIDWLNWLSLSFSNLSQYYYAAHFNLVHLFRIFLLLLLVLVRHSINNFFLFVNFFVCQLKYWLKRSKKNIENLNMFIFSWSCKTNKKIKRLAKWYIIECEWKY